MAVYSDLPQSIRGGTITPAWVNRLLDAVRRRTIIGGRGILATSTPNGTIITATANGGGGGVTAAGNAPWDLRVRDGFIEIYLPQNAHITVVALRNGDSSASSRYEVITPSVVNPASTEVGWRKVSKADFSSDEFQPPTGLTDIRAYIYKDANQALYGYRIVIGTWVNGLLYSSSAVVDSGWDMLYGRTIGVAEISAEKEAVSAYATAKQNSFLISDLDIPENGYDVPFSQNDSQTISEKITQLQNRLPSGGGSAAGLTDVIPSLDTPDGNAGSSTGAARADHQHPLQVSENLPADIPVDGFEGVETDNGAVGEASRYARADHVHGFPKVVGNDNSDADALDILPDGEGGSITGASGDVEQVGALGMSAFAAALDHSHPLNISADFNEVKDILKVGGTGATEGDLESCLGTSSTYARADHTHPISGMTWLANDPDLPSGATAGLSLLPDEGTNPSGSIGAGTLAAPIDHRHPLNINALDTRWGTGATGATSDTYGDDATGIIQPIGMFAKFGTSECYCREDHHHPIPTDGTGATGIGTSPSTDYPQTTGDYDGSDYGTGWDASWDRDNPNDYTIGASGISGGFQISVITAIKDVEIQEGISAKVAFFRTLTFDAYGCCRMASEVTHGVGLGLT